MLTSMPRVGIVVPCYNHGIYLRDCLQSVLNQSYDNWVCIVVNDGSTDLTEQVALEFTQLDQRFKYHYQENQGLSASRNKGIALTSSEFILPLDADDMLEPDYIQKVLGLFQIKPEIKVGYSDYRYFGLKERDEKLPTFSYKKLHLENMINATAIYRRSDFNKTGGYDTKLKGREDWDFWLSLLDSKSEVAKVHEPLFLYRQRANSMNRSLNQEILRDIRKYIYKKHEESFQQQGGFQSLASYMSFHEKQEIINKKNAWKAVLRRVIQKTPIQLMINTVSRKLTKIKDKPYVNQLTRSFGKIGEVDNPIVVVAVPGSVYLVNLFVSLVPPELPVIIVDNGLDAFEKTWLSTHTNGCDIAATQKMLPHSTIIDVLLNHKWDSVTLLDFDCFVLNSDLFHRLRGGLDSAMMASLFKNPHTFSPLEIPETFCLSLNVPIIKTVIKKYNVDASLVTFKQLTKKVKTALQKVDVTEGNLPEKYKPYLDTLRLIYLLGRAEGYRCNFVAEFPTISKPNDQAFHVGAGHKTNKLNNLWNMRGTYFWRKSIELCPDATLREYYYGKYGNMKSHEIKFFAPEVYKTVGDRFFEFTDRMLADLILSDRRM